MSRERRSVIEPVACRSCGELILWAVWPRSGKAMPVNVTATKGDPALGGDLVLTLHGGAKGELRVEKYHSQVHGFERNRYTSHFASCPAASQHRRPR